jgi:glycine cleavage system regulatory protein
MGHLGGQFAGILRVQVDADSVDAMTDALRALESSELKVVVHRGDGPDAAEPGIAALSLEVIGHDRPGIVSEITRVLAGFEVNVEALETERLSAPMSGEMLFQARARIVLPPDCRVADVRSKLEEIASDLMVELRLEQE